MCSLEPCQQIIIVTRVIPQKYVVGCKKDYKVRYAVCLWCGGRRMIGSVRYDRTS
jgi:hypothetical protein